MSLKNDFYIQKIPNSLAIELAIKYHYLHAKPNSKYSYGLFNKENILVGFVIYGIPASYALRESVAGKTYKNNVLELTRLWIDDSVPKNAESFLIGNTLKFFNNKIIVSYSDTAYGHVGTVYQATNWLYTGTNQLRKDLVHKDQPNKHPMALAFGKTYQQVKAEHGDSVFYKERSLKHRYIFITYKGKSAKLLMTRLKFKVLPYPKK